MITIIHIIESLSDYGGTPRKLLYLSQYLDTKKCRQIFYCYLPSNLKSEFERHGDIVVCGNNSSILDITRNAISLVRKHRANAIYTHFTRPLVAGYFAALATGLPIIHNEHSSANYRQGIGRFIAKIILPRVQAITCNSKYTLNSISESFSIPTEKMRVMHNPVVSRESNLPRTELRMQFGISDNDLVVGHIGGLIPQRDQSTLINAFAKIRVKNDKARLFVIGDGPKRSELESLVCSLGLGDCVSFVGYTNKIGDYLKIMDIYVNPTLDEGFGIAVVEAMLAGLPVVLSNKGAHPELIDDGTSGYLYQAGDVDALALIISRLAVNPEARAIIGNAAKIRAATHFTPEQYSATFIDHALEIINLYNMTAHALR